MLYTPISVKNVVVICVEEVESIGLLSWLLAHDTLAGPVLVRLIAIPEVAFATLVRQHHPVEASEPALDSAIVVWLRELHGDTVGTDGVHVLWVAHLLVPLTSESLHINWVHVVGWWARAERHSGVD